MRKGCEVVLLTDRLDKMDVKKPPIPSLLAVGAVHHHLIRSVTSCLQKTLHIRVPQPPD